MTPTLDLSGSSAVSLAETLGINPDRIPLCAEWLWTDGAHDFSEDAAALSSAIGLDDTGPDYPSRRTLIALLMVFRDSAITPSVAKSTIRAWRDMTESTISDALIESETERVYGSDERLTCDSLKQIRLIGQECLVHCGYPKNGIPAQHWLDTEITEAELEAYSLPAGPKFECYLPDDHFITLLTAYGTDISDAYPEYWFAAGIFALAVVADKQIRVELKQGTIYTNLYISMNGKSSLSRKSTVVDKVENLLCRVNNALISARVPTEFSPEAFTEHLSEYNHAPWIRDEAAGVLCLMKRDYMRGFKDSLMQLYDCKPFYRKLRTSQRKGTQTEFRVDDPYLNLLWATTDASLGANTEQNDTLSGFMARFLFFFPQGNKDRWMPLEEGTPANSVFETAVMDRLAGIASTVKAFIDAPVTMHFSRDAASYYIEWQRTREAEWIPSGDGNAMQIYSRLAPTVVKLAMLFELGSMDFNVGKPIRREYIEEACRLVDSYFLPTARAVYDLVGANAEKNTIDRIIAYLRKHNGKATQKEILRDVKIKCKDFQEYLEAMIESDMVEVKIVSRGGKGRDSVYILLLDTARVGNVSKVANVSKIAKVEEDIYKEHITGISSTLATLATQDTQDILATRPDNSCDKIDENTTDETIDKSGQPSTEPPSQADQASEMERRGLSIRDGTEPPGEDLPISDKMNVPLEMASRELMDAAGAFTARALANKARKENGEAYHWLKAKEAAGKAVIKERRNWGGDLWVMVAG